MIRSSTLTAILLYLNNFPQNKHITTLFIAHVSVLLMPVNQFSCSCEETLREARKRTKKKERSLERWPLPQIPLFFYMYFAHFSWWINPQTEALSWLEVLLSGATTLVTGVGKKSFCTHFAPPHPWAMLTKHFHLTQVCILPFSNIEWGNGVVDTHCVGITIMIWCFWHFPTQFVHDCSCVCVWYR